jgi:hypothetical protein
MMETMKNKHIGKRITIDQLATMVINGFAELRTEMNERFDGVQSQIRGIDHRIDDLAENKVSWADIKK